MNISTILVCCLGRRYTHKTTHIIWIQYIQILTIVYMQNWKHYTGLCNNPPPVENLHREVLNEYKTSTGIFLCGGVFSHTYNYQRLQVNTAYRQYLHYCRKDEACLHKLLVHIWLLTDGSHVCSCHTMLGDRVQSELCLHNVWKHWWPLWHWVIWQRFQ